MVKVSAYKQREREDGTLFYVLVLEGGLEIVQSSESGQMYATTKTATIPSTFNEVQCEALIGSEIKGSIIKEDCEPFNYVIEKTGEEIILHHRWVYSPDEDGKPKPQEQTETNPFLGETSFSKNGSLKPA